MAALMLHGPHAAARRLNFPHAVAGGAGGGSVRPVVVSRSTAEGLLRAASGLATADCNDPAAATAAAAAAAARLTFSGEWVQLELSGPNVLFIECPPPMLLPNSVASAVPATASSPAPASPAPALPAPPAPASPLLSLPSACASAPPSPAISAVADCSSRRGSPCPLPAPSRAAAAAPSPASSAVSFSSSPLARSPSAPALASAPALLRLPPCALFSAPAPAPVEPPVARLTLAQPAPAPSPAAPATGGAAEEHERKAEAPRLFSLPSLPRIPSTKWPRLPSIDWLAVEGDNNNHCGNTDLFALLLDSDNANVDEFGIAVARSCAHADADVADLKMFDSARRELPRDSSSPAASGVSLECFVLHEAGGSLDDLLCF
eukprot:TRINITY_DN51659_c1_g2_i2.p1 TRINITY_DN51659_c1_g2~~TRINITY_DN51659_c1_g2_i2.p1  ORF type:complete len:392 (-),score=-28.55 TRINITY_DN51659_c1_g2_i2:420-1547(-)